MLSLRLLAAAVDGLLVLGLAILVVDLAGEERLDAAQARGRGELGIAGGGVGDSLRDLHRAGLRGDGHGALEGGLEAFAALGLEELVDAERGHADGEGGAALGAGGGERGDEGALAIGVPAVDALHLAGDGREVEKVAEVGEVAGAGAACRAAAVADYGNRHGDGR